jgi:hypothetical protein
MRVELRDGQWADLRERISHGQDKEIKRAYVHGTDGDVFEAQTVMVRHFAKAWHILDIDGAAIPLDDPAAVDRMPDDIVDDPVRHGDRSLQRDHPPKPAYAALIGRLLLGQAVTEREIDRLPDPDLFRDALLLSEVGTFSARDLDEMDTVLLSLVRKLRTSKTG